MRIAILALALILAIIAPTSAEERAYRLDRNNAALNFSIRQFGFRVHGAFTDLDGALKFDHDKPETADLSATARAASVDAGNATGAMLHAFDAEHYPEIRFVSTRIEPRGDGTARILGLLTLRGVTQPITLEARLSEADPPAFHATGSFRRSAFGIRGWPLSSDRVELTIDAPFVPG